MQEETHRKPGPPLRGFDQNQLEKWDREDLQKLGPKHPPESYSRIPTAEDAKSIGDKPKPSPID